MLNRNSTGLIDAFAPREAASQMMPLWKHRYMQNINRILSYNGEYNPANGTLFRHIDFGHYSQEKPLTNNLHRQQTTICAPTMLHPPSFLLQKPPVSMWKFRYSFLERDSENNSQTTPINPSTKDITYEKRILVVGKEKIDLSFVPPCHRAKVKKLQKNNSETAKYKQ
jgi:hypothetical protein